MGESRSERAGQRSLPSQCHSASVEKRRRRLDALIRQALSFDDEDAYSAGEVGFLARILVQATLPHSDPKSNEFVRRNGHYTLSILAPKEVGLPYGRYPRLVLAYLNTEAVKRKTRHIELDHHFSHFCAALGIPPTTGPRGSLPMLREQMQRLFTSTFQCIFHDEKNRHAGDGFLIAEKLALWWDPRRDCGNAAWGSHVVLSERFFREATEAPVPLDLRVLRALRSPFEIDIYVWLTWRFFRLRKPVMIPWRSLQLQFGCSYKNPRHFKRRFLRYLKSVLSYYPEVRLRNSASGLLLNPSPTHVSPRASQLKL
ncbi:MAG TPA: replication protein RepA [Thermoanaerobaculia bacterium]|nr:replication protein RepA [Thermoanaerobaculia bacterium]